MNKQFSGVLRTLVSTLVFSLAAIGLPSSGAFLNSYDYVFLIETEHLEDEFEYQGSKLGPVVKASVSYQQPGQGKPIRYESLWYHGWQVLGCKRLNEISLGGTKQVAIEVRHKERKAGREENAAAANALMRIFLDVSMAKSCVSTFVVPDNEIGAIEKELAEAGFSAGDPPAPDKPVYKSIVIPVRTASGDAKRFLFYYQ